MLSKVEETPDVTLADPRSLLNERGLSVGRGTEWRFFDRHEISFEKNGARRGATVPAAKTRPIWPSS